MSYCIEYGEIRFRALYRKILKEQFSVLFFFQNESRRTLPELKHVADNLCSSVGEKVITHSSPDSIAKNFQTSFVGTWTSYQSHYKITHRYWNCA